MRRQDNFIAKLVEGKVALADSYIIEIGCGSGYRSAQLSQAGARLYGIDPSPRLIREAHQRAMRENMPRALFACSTFVRLWAEESTFEAAVFSYSLHHVGRLDMSAAISEAVRVVEPCGEIAFWEPGPEGSLYDAELRFRSRDDDERIAKSCAYEAMKNHPQLEEVAELYDEEVFQFDTVDDYCQVMRPKIYAGLEDYLKANDFTLRAPRRLNVYRVNK